MKPHLWLVRTISRIVPRRFRSDWKQEWEAELHHRQSLGRPQLLRRSLGSFWDALAMQPRRLEDEMFQDVQYGIRMLLKNKLVTTVAILSLAIGIGANTAVFSVANAALFRKLPVENADDLFVLEWAASGREMVGSYTGNSYRDGRGTLVRSSFPDVAFDRFRSQTRTLSGLAAYQSIGTMNVNVRGDAQVASGLIVSGNYFRTLGVGASMGRVIADDDDRPDAAPVAVLTYRFWQRRFGLDRSVLGQTIVINTVPFTIVGITPRGFSGTDIFASSDIIIPLGVHKQINVWPEHDKWLWWLRMMGRRQPGITAQQVRDELQQSFRASVAESWDARPPRLRAPESEPLVMPELRVGDGSHGNGGNPAAAGVFSLMMAIVGLVLLIVCANIANLLIAKGSARRNEIAIRSALGAGRARLVRQLLVESVMLAACGAALGLIFAYWGQDFLSWAAPDDVGLEPRLDIRVLAFTAAVTVVAGILFGLAPGLRATRVGAIAAMKQHSRSVSHSRSRLSKALLIGQVAVSLVLLVGAGLFTRSLANMRSADVGFNTSNLVVFRVDPVPNKYTPAQMPDLYDRMLERLSAIPGVQAATLSENLLLSGSASSANLFRPGQDARESERNNVLVQAVRSNFFETMQMRMVRGRNLTAADKQNTPRVAVINETLARLFFENEEPIGRQVAFNNRGIRPIEIVGIVRDAKYRSVREAVLPTIFLPYLQRDINGMGFEIRTAADPAAMIPAVREAMREVDPNLPLIGIKTQEQQTRADMFEERLWDPLESTCRHASLSIL